MPSFMQRFFPMIDANKDNALTTEEMEQAQKMMENLRGRQRPATRTAAALTTQHIKIPGLANISPDFS